MARTKRRKVKKSKPNLFQRLLPEKFQEFVARRLVDIVALGVIGLGIFTALSLISYDPTDPSFNTVMSEAVQPQNWGGERGAHSADLLMQSVGYAAYIFAFVAFVLGLRMLRRHRIRPLALRVLALITGLFAGAVTLALAASLGWVDNVQAGGSFGVLAKNALAIFTQSRVLTIAFLGLTGVIALTATLYAAACRWAEIAAIVGFVKNVIVFAVMSVFAMLVRFKNWVAHYNDPDYEADTFLPALSFPKLKMPSLKRDDFEIVDPEPKLTPSQKPVAASPSPVLAAPKRDAHIPVLQSKPAPPSAPLANQQKLSLTEYGEWEYPPLSLIETPPPPKTQGKLDENALRRNAELLQNVLSDYGVHGEITSIRPGPVVTLYELEPAPGTKSSKVINLCDDIARSMAALSVRVSVVPGRSVIGIEIPNKTRQIVYLQDLLASKEFTDSKKALPLILGHDIGGKSTLADLSKMPHLLVAGTTGSGKSVAVNTMILSLLYSMSPDQCRFIMIDPKMLELSVYADIPHLLSPVVTEAGKAVVALKWAVGEMEDRYRAMSKIGVRNLEGYNARMREAQKNNETIMTKVQTGFDPETGKGIFEEQAMDLSELPLIVVVVDEFADLMLVAGKDVENAIQRLAQMARAAGIHLIMATQRPSVDVITGVIKANFPTRISFQVTSKIDSRTILGEGGAEQLLGMGDMLFMAPGGKIQRVHGPFVSDSDVEKVVDFLKAQREPDYVEGVTQGGDFGDSEVMNAMFGGGDDGEKVDELYDEAVAIIAREGKASTSFVQRHLQIGYNRAARIIEEMERQGVISKASSTGKREVLVSDHSDVA